MQPRSVRRAVLWVGGLVVMLLLGAGAALAQEMERGTTLTGGEPKTPTGDVLQPIYEQIMWLSVAVFLVVGIVLVYILVRFRHRRGDKRVVPQIHGNSRLEIAWTIGPALIMIWLLIISYNGLQAIDLPDAEPEVEIQVRASQFVWAFTYPDGTTAGRQQLQLDGETRLYSAMRVASDTWVRLTVTSGDVIHAINIPGLDVMIDAIPGRPNQVMFFAREPGVYMVQCRQFCGVGHGEMLAAVEIFERGSQEQLFGTPAAAPPTAPEEPTEPEQPGNGTGNDTDEVDATIDVTAHEYFFEPSDPMASLEPGSRVRFVLTNQGATVHNLFIGTYDRGAGQGQAHCAVPEDDTSCWNTRFSVDAGATDSIVVTMPDGPIAFDAWCDIPTHAQLGMLTWISSGGAEPTATGAPEPRLPGPGAALAALAIMGAAVLVARRRL